MNLRGIKESVGLNLGLTAIELTGLLLVVVIGLAFLLDGGGDPGRALEFKSGEAVPLAILAGASLAFFALIGFEDSVNVAEETRDPSRVFPRALFVGLGIAGAVYMLVTVIASMAVETSKLVESDGPLLEVVDQGPLAMSTKVFAAIALFALTNGALINLIMASRLVYGMSREGIVPKALGRVHPGRRTPYVAIAFTASLAALLVRRRQPRDARGHHRPAAAVRVRVRQHRGARAPARAGRARALPRADLGAGARRDHVRRADHPEGVRRHGDLRLRRRPARHRRRAVGGHPSSVAFSVMSTPLSAWETGQFSFAASAA